MGGEGQPQTQAAVYTRYVTFGQELQAAISAPPRLAELFTPQMRAYTRSGIANNCQGSSRSVAQAYEFGRQGLKVPMAFGADLNGFIQQTRPRFGDRTAAVVRAGCG